MALSERTQVNSYSRFGAAGHMAISANDRPPIVVSRGASGGCGGGACWLRPSRRVTRRTEDASDRSASRGLSRRGPQVRGGTPALTVTQCPWDQAHVAMRA